jgi:hypothetical protein
MASPLQRPRHRAFSPGHKQAITVRISVVMQAGVLAGKKAAKFYLSLSASARQVKGW